MKVLITGATGLIGREIVKYCQVGNIAVNYLTTSKEKIVAEPDFKGFYWNPNLGDIDLRCFEGVSAIINLAGASISKRWTPSYKRTILSSRVSTLRTLYNALDKIDHSAITSFVSASAIGVYPDSLTNYYTENETAVDDSFLGEVVEAWEKEADRFNDFDFNVAKIRIGLVMSQEGGALPEIARPIRNYVGAAFGSGQQWQSWIHISDLARIFLFTVENQLKGIYNGVGPNPVTNNKLVKEIAVVVNKPIFLPNIPAFVMRTILGQMSHILFASQRVSCKKIEEEGFHFNFPNICVALEAIYEERQRDNSNDVAYNKEYIS